MKIDFKKTLDSYQAKRGEFRLVEVPAMQYLMIDGHGDPNTAIEYTQSIEALYPMAYALKFMSKKELNKDYVVGPLEGLWWADNMNDFTATRDKSKWDWTSMIMVPDWISLDMFAAAKAKVAAKKEAPTALAKIRLEMLEEGLVVQTLHIGSFDDEGPILEKLHHEFMPSENLEPVKKHHEVYFSDFRKVPKEKLRTILRQPVQRIGAK